MKTRTKILSLLAAALAWLSVPALAADNYDLKIGMQTWTLRNLNFDQVVEFCVKHKIKYLQLIPNHINPNGSKEEWQKKKDILEKNGLVPYTFGVAGTSLNKEDNRKLFEFAKFMGMKLVAVEPGDYKILDNLEELAKEYDIKVCIHNHDIKSPYGNPAVVRNLIKHRDARIGVCMDAGWVATTRIDVPKTYREYNGRVYDIHLKDKKVHGGPNGDRWDDTFLGEGDAKLAELFKVLKESKYDGVLAIETDKDLKDPTEHVTRALEFIKANKP
jgi:sugar phosphate isomerase/epimerase